MATTTYTDDVEIIGSQDEVQLLVRGDSGQTQALQQWQLSDDTTVAEVREDGRLRVGGDLSLTAPSALVEANQTVTSASLVKQGWQALGKVSGAISEAVAWIVHELRFEGSGGITGLHTTLRARLVNLQTGDSSEAGLRAIHAQAINESGSAEAPVGHISGLHVDVENNAPEEDTAHLNQAAGVEITLANTEDAYLDEWVAVDIASPENNGTITDQYGLRVGDLAGASSNYAVYTGAGLVHLGDVVELETVAEPATPPSNTLRLYAKSDGKIYAKNSSGEVFDLTEVGGSSNAPDYDSGWFTVAPSTSYYLTHALSDIKLVEVWWSNSSPPSMSSLHSKVPIGAGTGAVAAYWYGTTILIVTSTYVFPPSSTMGSYRVLAWE